ncbi:MAG: thiamine phosphate synthase [bacterium]|nr:thiamine phosphate synthase [bacterium]
MKHEKMIAVTNRSLCDPKRYFEQIEKISALHPQMLVLREKDLPVDVYIDLAKKVQKICDEQGTPLVLHQYVEAVIELKHHAIHLPLKKLQKLVEAEDATWLLAKETLVRIGTSVHSVDDAHLAKKLGATYVFAGNIYETDCKKGLPGKGLDYLKDVVNAVDIPVYGIGGITPENLSEVLQTGAAGGCMMSGYMKC